MKHLSKQQLEELHFLATARAETMARNNYLLVANKLEEVAAALYLEIRDYGPADTWTTGEVFWLVSNMAESVPEIKELGEYKELARDRRERN